MPIVAAVLLFIGGGVVGWFAREVWACGDSPFDASMYNADGKLRGPR